MKVLYLLDLGVVKLGKLYFTIGLPRSGKSTWCRNFAKENQITILSGDDFRLAITNERYNIHSELFVKASLITAAKALLISGQDVIIDETNSTDYSLNQLFHLDKNPEIIFFHTPKCICTDRAKTTNHLDLPPVIDRIEYNLQILRENIVLGKEKRINKDNTTEIGPIMYHLFSDDPYKVN